MPKMNGFELLASLKEKKIKQPTVILSNLSQEDDVKRAKEFGVLDFVVKSDTGIYEIVEKIKKLL
jgi:DNA-binding NarL/FixJ family response regulator